VERISDGLVLWTVWQNCRGSKLVMHEGGNTMLFNAFITTRDCWGTGLVGYGFSLILDDNGFIATMTSFSQTFWTSNAKTPCLGKNKPTNFYIPISFVYFPLS
jgi:hypothetical protein